MKALTQVLNIVQTPITGTFSKHLVKQISNKALDFSVRWMPSHLSEAPAKGVSIGFTWQDLHGNVAADAKASEASMETSKVIPQDVAADIVNNCRLVTRIQGRLAAILMSLPDRPKLFKPAPTPRESLASLVDCSSHAVIDDDDTHVKCIRCLSSFRRNDPQARKWFQTACPIIGSSKEHPIPLFFTNLHIGRQVAHHAHKLYSYKGLVYCNRCRCGAGSHVLKELSELCTPPTSYGIESLNALRDRKLPPNLTHWPSETPPKSSKKVTKEAGLDFPFKRAKAMRPAPVPLEMLLLRR